MAFAASKSLLLIGGAAPATEASAPATPASGIGIPACIRAWRAINSAPYFESIATAATQESPAAAAAADDDVDDTDADAAKGDRNRTIDVSAATSRAAVASSAVFEVAVSPDGAELAAVDCRGRITTMKLPSLRTAGVYPGREVAMSINKKSSAAAASTAPSLNGVGAGIAYTGVVELGWWSNNSLVVTNAVGSVAVLTVVCVLRSEYQ